MYGDRSFLGEICFTLAEITHNRIKMVSNLKRFIQILVNNRNMLYSMIFGFGLATYMTLIKSNSECAPAKEASSSATPEPNFTRNTLTSRAFVL
jgi:hypothetical protein